jgi:hypothetical protein
MDATKRFAKILLEEEMISAPGGGRDAGIGGADGR